MTQQPQHPEQAEQSDQPDAGPLEPYDGILLLSFGGPEKAEDVLPFLRRVTAGRGIPDERLEQVGEHYYGFGGRSPINDQNRALIAALRAELDRRDISTPIIWGNRNFTPFTAEAFAEAQERGMRRIVTVLTSAYQSYSSCRQYREDLAAADAEVSEQGPAIEVDKVRPYANHPGFSRTNTRLVTEAVRGLLREGVDPATVRLLCVTHSIPDAMDDTSGPGDEDGNAYSRQHIQLGAAITEEVNATLDTDLEGELVFCSRSGPPTQPWLEPDVNDRLEELAADGVQTVVLAPIGFVSDHMEVVYDLDTEAAATAEKLGLRLVRVPTVGVDPEFVSGLVDLLLERAAEARGEDPVRPVWPGRTAPPSVCAPGCCPNLRTARPALCGRD
ncbi:ferrochelatase [Knoellia koreensis]|uniref:Coproporphyrin III ferrochelatase n=1 Tax=Knoellia koreensis TaxID=2730921 RepID=A0A849HKL1_9MICO|nr:ferrochelatase [Knoellia sp. DB2414S]NNM45187.1 ferrochelatase [Knoellia sp. DB2414S]